jgi:hypothetical protein
LYRDAILRTAVGVWVLDVTELYIFLDTNVILEWG